MEFVKRLRGLFGSSAQPRDTHMYSFAVKCNRCGEIIQARVNLSNELSVEYNEKGNAAVYLCRKVLIGNQHCFQPIEVTLKFDSRHRLIEQQVTGGQFYS